MESQIEDWRQWLLNQETHSKGKSTTLSPKCVKEHLEWLSAVYKYYRLDNPCIHVERPQRSHADRQESLKYYSVDEMNALLAMSGKLADDERIGNTGKDHWRQFYYWFRMLAFTGMRIGEARGIRFKDIIWKDNIVYVISEKTKTRRPLKLEGGGGIGQCPIFLRKLESIAIKHYKPAQGLLDLLRKRNEIRKELAEKRLFLPAKNYFYRHLETLCKKAEIEFKSVHALRHTFATQAIRTWHLPMLAKWLGHKDYRTTFEIYSHFAPETPPRLWYGD